jgi:hypothetical protein
MPYIKEERRLRLNESIMRLGERIKEPGELNYVFYCLAREYVKKFGLSYKILNEVIGVFAACKAEFIRRVVSPYEDKKIEENGDI